MIRLRFPFKTTLSIGDGANDVSMILKAHIGVGILGKEGQQAARSADYAIGQFKFLKRLLFVHGREAYRRNSMALLYSFYKNFLYVCTQYWFGFSSAFSGQPMFEPFIYQLFNITMTSLPIMWFAVFDFQHNKKQLDSEDVENVKMNGQEDDYFMLNPKLYQIGMNATCFSNSLFVLWIIYGLWQSFVIYVINFWVIEKDGQTLFGGLDTGKEAGFWVGG